MWAKTFTVSFGGVTDTHKSCENCSASCVSCASNTECTQCSNTTILIVNGSVVECVSLCPSGYYNASDSCLSCPAGCLECYMSQGQVICRSCNSSLTLLSG